MELLELTLGDLVVVGLLTCSSSEDSIVLLLILECLEENEASGSSSEVAALILSTEGCVGSSTPSSELLSMEATLFLLFSTLLALVLAVSSADDSALIRSFDG